MEINGYELPRNLTSGCITLFGNPSISKVFGSKMSEWISVKDRLPPFGVPVLVLDRYGSVKTKGSIRQVSRNKSSRKNNWQERPDWEKPRYSHWMPLPEPPKE